MSSVQLIENLRPADAIVGHYINGQVMADSGRTQAIYNPATGQVARRVALASKATVAKAIAAAAAAYPGWRRTPPMKRARIHVPFQGIIGATRG